MSARHTVAAGVALVEAGLVEHRIERLQTEARLAKLRAADELTKAGRGDEGKTLLAEVAKEQQR